MVKKSPLVWSKIFVNFLLYLALIKDGLDNVDKVCELWHNQLISQHFVDKLKVMLKTPENREQTIG